MWGCFVPKGHQPCADLSVSVTHQHLPEGSHPVTRVFSGLQSPFPSPMCFGSVGVSADSSVSHGVVTAGRASRLSPPHRKALIPLCSQPVQHLSHPHREPLQSQPFPGFRASLPSLWGCVGFLWCHCVLSLCPQASLVPQLPCLGLGTLLPCGSVAPGVCLVAWGPSLPFSPLASSFPLCSPFLVNPRAPVCSRGLSSGAGSLRCPYKGLVGQIKGLSLRVSDRSQQQLCREGHRSKASPAHSLEMSASLSVPQTLRSTQLLPRGSVFEILEGTRPGRRIFICVLIISRDSKGK